MMELGLISPGDSALILPTHWQLLLISWSPRGRVKALLQELPGQANSCPGLASQQPGSCSEPGRGFLEVGAQECRLQHQSQTAEPAVGCKPPGALHELVICFFPSRLCRSVLQPTERMLGPPYVRDRAASSKAMVPSEGSSGTSTLHRGPQASLASELGWPLSPWAPPRPTCSSRCQRSRSSSWGKRDLY